MALLALAGGLVAAATAQAATVDVSPRATGGFGSPNDGFQPLEMGIALLDGQSVQISATGTVTLCTPACIGAETVFNNIGPNGVTITGFFGNLFPLEEGFNDGPGPDIAEDPSFNAGALMGAFVASGIVNAAGFSATDADLPGGDVLSTALFLIGAGPFVFTAPEDGTLFLGVNETFAANDNLDTFFTVTLNILPTVPAPEPATLAMLGTTLLGLAWARRRARASA